MSWDKLTHKELLKTLDEDFAFPLTDAERKTKEKTLAAVGEGNLRFADYLIAHPEEREKYVEEPAEPVTGAELAAQVLAEKTFTPNEVQDTVQVKQEPKGDGAPWLIKMERDNGTFEVGKYRFTREHPYVLVQESDVSKILKEGGFRQAYPEELSEFY